MGRKKCDYDKLRLKLNKIYVKFMNRFELKNVPYIDRKYIDSSYNSSIKQLKAIDKELYASNAVYSKELIERSHKYRNEIEFLYEKNLKLLDRRDRIALQNSIELEDINLTNVLKYQYFE